MEALDTFYLSAACRQVQTASLQKKSFPSKFSHFIQSSIISMIYVCQCLSCRQEEEAFELFDLVIILRLWRIVRVVNGKEKEDITNIFSWPIRGPMWSGGWVCVIGERRKRGKV